MLKQRPLYARDGHLNEEGVALYVDALKLERTAELPRETRMHVSQCQRCRKEITGLFALLTDADYSGAVPHPFFEGGSRGERWRIPEFLRVAAAVAAVVGAALVVYYLSTQSEDDGPATAQHAERAVEEGNEVTSDTTYFRAPEAGGELLAENFAELADLEDLVNADRRAASIHSVSPRIGEVVGDPVVFRWSPETQGPVYLEILDNREEVIHSGQVLSLPYVVQKPTTPGLYYWKLVGNEELVLVGKFLVKE
jgi:hypothetical protein